MLSLADKTAIWERERRKKLGLPEEKIVDPVLCIFCNIIQDVRDMRYTFVEDGVNKGGCHECMNKKIADIPPLKEVICLECNTVFTRAQLGEIILRSWNWRSLRYEGLCRSCVRSGRVNKNQIAEKLL